MALTPAQEAEYWVLKGEESARKKHQEWLESVDAKVLKAREDRAKDAHHSEPNPEFYQ